MAVSFQHPSATCFNVAHFPSGIRTGLEGEKKNCCHKGSPGCHYTDNHAWHGASVKKEGVLHKDLSMAPEQRIWAFSAEIQRDWEILLVFVWMGKKRIIVVTLWKGLTCVTFCFSNNQVKLVSLALLHKHSIIWRVLDNEFALELFGE